MATATVANAFPRKRFFIEMFTRDISLADSILDLIDNSIDGVVRSRKLDLSATLFRERKESNSQRKRLPTINVEISDRRISVKDNCGGIRYSDARDEVFNFGHEFDFDVKQENTQLGVYGVGLKRAIFKLGDTFEMESHTLQDGFIVKEPSLSEWVKKDQELTDWSFPLKKLDKAKSNATAGTRLVVTKLHDEVLSAAKDPTFLSRLSRDISKAYALFLNEFVRVNVNGMAIDAIPVPLGHSDQITPGYERQVYDGVTVDIYTSLAEREAGKWKAEQSGWYVACNGRMVIVANKDELTGWGTPYLPLFHTSKFRGFVGLVLFESDDPYKLPWTTTKRGINEESSVYKYARVDMSRMARPVIRFLDSMYPGEISEDVPERAVANRAEKTDVPSITKMGESNFQVKSRKGIPKKRTTNVQYRVDTSEIESIKKVLADPTLAASEIGRKSFYEYLQKLTGGEA